MRKFKKAPKYIGKYLSIQAGSGSKIVKDNEILEGDKWAKFVDYGFLVEILEPKKVFLIKPVEIKPAPAPEPKPKPVEVDPEPEPEPEPKPEPETEKEELETPVKRKRGRRKKSSK